MQIAYNSWEAPPCFQFREWALDAQLHGIPLPLARELYQTLDYFLTAHPPAVVYKARAGRGPGWRAGKRCCRCCCVMLAGPGQAINRLPACLPACSLRAPIRRWGCYPSW